MMLAKVKFRTPPVPRWMNAIASITTIVFCAAVVRTAYIYMVRPKVVDGGLVITIALLAALALNWLVLAQMHRATLARRERERVIELYDLYKQSEVSG